MKRFAAITISLFFLVSIGLSIYAAQYNPEVYQAQKELKSRGYNPGTPDGLWGKSTESAIKRFQRDMGLPVTGLLDEETKVKLGMPSLKRSLNQRVTPDERRIALVIGNGTYRSAPLRNPVNDASDISDALERHGFEVDKKLNVPQETMEDAIREFGSKLHEGTVGLFYYSGHGVQVSGRNYLIPIGARIVKEKDVKYKAVDLYQVLDEMGSARNGLNIVILDACRDNPLQRSWRSKSQGLMRVEGPKGTLIAYSTAPGSVAEDGEGRNGTYTKHLLRAMNIQGLLVEQVFKEVLKAVDSETRGKQTPWMSSSFTGDFYFNPRSSTDFDIKRQRLEEERRRFETERKQLEEEKRLAKEQRKHTAEHKRLDAKKQKPQMAIPGLEDKKSASPTVAAIDPKDKKLYPLATHFQSLSVEKLKNGVSISVKANGPIQKFNIFTINSPARIVIDIYNLKGTLRKEQPLPVNTEWVKRIRYYGYPDRLRIVVNTTKQYLSAYSATPKNEGLLIRVGEISGLTH